MGDGAGDVTREAYMGASDACVGSMAAAAGSMATTGVGGIEAATEAGMEAAVVTLTGPKWDGRRGGEGGLGGDGETGDECICEAWEGWNG